jgi:hypothetical protein
MKDIILDRRIGLLGPGWTVEELSGFITEMNFGCQHRHEELPCDCYPALCLDSM